MRAWKLSLMKKPRIIQKQKPWPVAPCPAMGNERNDPRSSKRRAATAEIATSSMEIHISQPLVADAASLPKKTVNRASNDPRAKRREKAEGSQEETI